MVYLRVPFFFKVEFVGYFAYVTNLIQYADLQIFCIFLMGSVLAHVNLNITWLFPSQVQYIKADGGAIHHLIDLELQIFSNFSCLDEVIVICTRWYGLDSAPDKYIFELLGIIQQVNESVVNL